MLPGSIFKSQIKVRHAAVIARSTPAPVFMKHADRWLGRVFLVCPYARVLRVSTVLSIMGLQRIVLNSTSPPREPRD